MAITGTRLALAPGRGYTVVAAYVSGTVTTHRVLHGTSQVLSYPVSASGVITTGADDTQFGLTRLHGAGGALMAAISKSGTVQTFISRDEGATWVVL